jgi:predicted HAD superfamily phosphohydrolase YqeG
MAVTPDMLAQIGVKTLSLDVDGSIMSHHAAEIPAEILEHLRAIGQSGIRIAFSSNAYNGRVAELEEIATTINPEVAVVTPSSVSPNLEEESVKRYRKPNPAMIFEVARHTGTEVEEVLHGGDQAFKDVLAANRAGAKSLLIPKYGVGGDWRVEYLQRPLEGAMLPFFGVRSLRRQVAMRSL